jgi:hypothetical protein
MSKVSFKISYLFPGKEPQSCEFLSVDRKTGMTSFIDQNGGLKYRAPDGNEKPLNQKLKEFYDK